MATLWLQWPVLAVVTSKPLEYLRPLAIFGFTSRVGGSRGILHPENLHNCQFHLSQPPSYLGNLWLVREGIFIAAYGQYKP